MKLVHLDVLPSFTLQHVPSFHHLLYLLPFAPMFTLIILRSLSNSFCKSFRRCIPMYPVLFTVMYRSMYDVLSFEFFSLPPYSLFFLVHFHIPPSSSSLPRSLSTARDWMNKMYWTTPLTSSLPLMRSLPWDTGRM